MNIQKIIQACARNHQQFARSSILKVQPPRVLLQLPASARLPTQACCCALSTDTFGIDKPNGFSQTVFKRVKVYFRRYKLRVAGFKLYEAIADQIDYSEFMTKLEMPDTFYSWFMLTELHVWMLMVRLMANPYEGRTVRNFVVEALWKDVTTRSKKLGTEHLSIIGNQIHELNEGFQAALVLYDEGLLSSDKVLAGALWRRLFNQNCNSAHHLEAMIRYVRYSMRMLDATELEDLVNGKPLKWTSIDQIFKELKEK